MRRETPSRCRGCDRDRRVTLMIGAERLRRAAALAAVAARADAPPPAARPTVRHGPGRRRRSSATSSASAACRCSAPRPSSSAPARARRSLVSDSTVDGARPAGNPAAAISPAARDRARRRPATAPSACGPRRRRSSGSTPPAAGSPGSVTLPSAPPARRLRLVTRRRAHAGSVLRSRDVLQHATGTRGDLQPEPGRRAGRLRRAQGPQGQGLAAADVAALPVTLERITSAKGCLKGTYVDARVTKKGKKVCAPSLDFTRLTRSNNGSRPDGLLPHRPHPRVRRQPRALRAAARASRRRCSPTRSPTTTRSTRR